MQTIFIVCKHDVIICSIQEKPNVINLNFYTQQFTAILENFYYLDTKFFYSFPFKKFLTF